MAQPLSLSESPRGAAQPPLAALIPPLCLELLHPPPCRHLRPGAGQRTTGKTPPSPSWHYPLLLSSRQKGWSPKKETKKLWGEAGLAGGPEGCVGWAAAQHLQCFGDVVLLSTARIADWACSPWHTLASPAQKQLRFGKDGQSSPGGRRFPT